MLNILAFKILTLKSSFLCHPRVLTMTFLSRYIFQCSSNSGTTALTLQDYIPVTSLFFLPYLPDLNWPELTDLTRPSSSWHYKTMLDPVIHFYSPLLPWSPNLTWPDLSWHDSSYAFWHYFLLQCLFSLFSCKPDLTCSDLTWADLRHHVIVRIYDLLLHFCPLLFLLDLIWADFNFLSVIWLCTFLSLLPDVIFTLIDITWLSWSGGFFTLLLPSRLDFSWPDTHLRNNTLR